MSKEYEDKEKQSEYKGWYMEGWNDALSRVREYLNQQEQKSNE
jgi:hypothetical protein